MRTTRAPPARPALPATSAPAAPAARAVRAARPGLAALSLGYFTLGTASLAVVGLGGPIGRDLHTATFAGQQGVNGTLNRAPAAPLAEFVAGLRGQLPELRFELRRLAAEGDLVFAHSHFTAAPGDPGRAVVDVFRIADGLIAEHWDLDEGVPESTASGRAIV
ncbi:nuclear transport factor 2 family protein [Kitasatospora sp. NBC_00240]|uniref:nuclear transport factor 2 family protein n=1 Tax=Kitasatospora sp. NBC_00240 TaxID=2903567 RepID=UPI002253900F|nr:nuclear transport factor 2 family protein [Kitasatospora sp. NBC_00240]MCX5213076.1 nuclear transport factor 2 family protein [Kitasatospora sp. NBC_00240]